MKKTTFTSESVAQGHPDKVCDQISDAIVDEAIRQYPYSRVAVETLVTENFIALAGEAKMPQDSSVDYEKIARDTIKKLGYTNPAFNFTHESPITIKIHEQSEEIAQGVDAQGAGDQGMMFGFATRECDELMPLPITMAHRLVEKLDALREDKTLPFLRPDGKSQVTVAYENLKPVGVENVVMAVPHDEDIALEDVKKQVYEQVVLPVLEKYGYTIPMKDVVLNGTGVWHMPGPGSDTGVTGRKIVVDTYGGMGRVGGGAFSGKDPTKVDRSGAYAARYLAKNIVAAGMADTCEVRLAYFIGAVEPVMQKVETFGTESAKASVIEEYMQSLIDTSVKGIIEHLDLCRPIYYKTASYGHFGRMEFPWEKIVG